MSNTNTTAKKLTGKKIAAMVADLETECRFDEAGSVAMGWVHAGPAPKFSGGIDYSRNARHASLNRAGLICYGTWMTVGRAAAIKAAM